jgi:hypothetical protein
MGGAGENYFRKRVIEFGVEQEFVTNTSDANPGGKVSNKQIPRSFFRTSA